jgi:hypothetical protein
MRKSASLDANCEEHRMQDVPSARPLIVHTGEELAAQHAVDVPPAVEPPGAKRTVSPVPSPRLIHRRVELLKALLAVCYAVAGVLIWAVLLKPAPGDGIASLFRIIAAVFGTGVLIVGFFVQAYIMSALEAARCPVWVIAVINFLVVPAALIFVVLLRQ